MELFSISYVLLSVQNALLGVVTPDLRAVVVDVSKEKKLLYIRFYYHGTVQREIIELWECAITESSADFGPESTLDEKIERLDHPKEIPFRGRYAFLRKE